MATLTAIPTNKTMSMGASSQYGSTTITWTAPKLPDGSTVISCILTGTIRSSNTITGIVINNQTVSTSTGPFSVDLGNTVSSSVDVTVTKPRGDYTTVIFANMKYTVTYKEPTLPVTSISLDSTASIMVGNTITLQATLNPLNANNYNLVWSSDNSNVTLNPNDTSCTVTGATVGSSVVTTTDSISGNSASCTVTVTSKVYTVRFLDLDNNVLKTETVEEGQSATPPDVPPINGYLFTSWNIDYGNITANTDVKAQYVQEFGVPANNIMPLFTNDSWDSWGATDWQRKDSSISLKCTDAWGNIFIPYPTDWCDKTIFISFSNISTNTTVLVQNISTISNALYLDSNTTSGSVNIPSSESSNYYIKVQCGDYATNIYVTDLYAAFAYTITASSNVGGSISPDRETVVPENGSKSYRISANIGYGIKDVLIDGVSQGPITSYTFTNVNSDHTIEVIFEPVPTVVAAIEKNKMHAIGLIEGESNMSLDINGLHVVKVYEDLAEDESIYLDENGVLHVYEFLLDLVDSEYEIKYIDNNEELITNGIDFAYAEANESVVISIKNITYDTNNENLIIGDNNG